MKDFDLTLYLVTDSTGHDLSSFLQTVEEACRGGVTLVQLREKSSGGREYLERAIAVKEITDRYHIPLMIDDRIDVAIACGAAGVHVGRSDLPVSCARALLGPDKIVGATAKTPAQALEAFEQGADYLGVGAIFPTTTKVATMLTPVTTLTEIRRAVPLPIVAIGGLNRDNMDVLKESPADGIAVVSAIMQSKTPRETAGKLYEHMSTLKILIKSNRG